VNAALTVVAVLVAAGAVRVLSDTLPPLRRAAIAPAPSAGEGTGDREHLDRVVSAATSHAGDLHLRLRPILREIAADGLRRRGGGRDAPPPAAPELGAPARRRARRPAAGRAGAARARHLGDRAPRSPAAR
jgi:hypothetical protein